MSVRVDAGAETVHWGYFDAALAPIVTIDSGDTVTIGSVSGPPDVMPGPPFKIPPALPAIHQATTRRMVPGHMCTGPVAVRGARAGQVLQVDIEAIDLAYDWGYVSHRPLVGALPYDFPERDLIHPTLDGKRMVGHLPWGMEIALKPFFGVMGVAPPPAWGAISTLPPRQNGGNLDNKELTAGTTLYLPIFVDGALFSAGDGHAVQGDGEVCLTALETCMRGTFELIVRKDLNVKFPRAETPTHHITMGLDVDLDDAAKQALREMIKLLGELAQLPPADAYTLCSLACDLRVTQLVDGNKGIHAMLDKKFVPGA